jgi:hypothetical protein
VSEARSHQRRGKKTPTLMTLGREAIEHEESTRVTTSRSGLGCRETSGPPENRTEPYSPWDLPAAKVARVIREHTRCGCTQFDWVAEVGQTHRASSSPGGRKTCWRARALARRKSVAPPDAGRGWAEGETVRVCEVIKNLFMHDLRVSACRLSIRRKAFSGFLPALLSPAGRRRVL